ncbi:MAG TPA: hypothetical protein VGL15_11535, partial [Vicinamibacteria bacterium]
MRLMRNVSLAAIAALVLAAPAFAQKSSKPADGSQLRADMRKLWEDHVTWTRVYIISVANGTADKDVTAGRLLQNQVDIGNAIKPFYGDEAGNKLTGLLKDHILGAAALLDAARAGDKAKTESTKAAWYRNADDVAAFLAGANPKNWPLADMKREMKMHLDLTLQESLDRFGGKFAEDIRDYDRV